MFHLQRVCGFETGKQSVLCMLVASLASSVLIEYPSGEAFAGLVGTRRDRIEFLF